MPSLVNPKSCPHIIGDRSLKKLIFRKLIQSKNRLEKSHKHRFAGKKSENRCQSNRKIAKSSPKQPFTSTARPQCGTHETQPIETRK